MTQGMMLARTGLLVHLLLPLVSGLSLVQDVAVPEPVDEPEPELVKALPAPCEYIASVPRRIRPGQKFDVFVAIYKSEYTDWRVKGKITVKLIDAGSNPVVTYASKTVRIRAEKPRRRRPIREVKGRKITLLVPPDLTASTYKVVVSSSGPVVFTDDVYVQLERKVYNGFVQTDKGMYNPGNTVRYRVLSLDQTLSTYKDYYDIIVYDPNGNRIKQELAVRDNVTGLLEGELKLSEEPVMGEWKIDVKTPDMSFSKTFEVRQYVLPRFSVSVMPGKSFTVSTDITVQGVIEAKYTTGKPVKGSVIVTAKVDPWYSWYNKSLSGQPTESQTFQIDGQAFYSFTVDRLKSLTMLNSFVKKDVTITAEVTEDLTGETASASTKTKVFATTEKIEFVESNPATFKPKLKYYGQIKVQQQNGRPLIGETGYVTLEIRVEIPERTTTAAPTTTQNVTVAGGDVVAEDIALEPVEVVPIMIDWWNPYPPREPTEWINLDSHELTLLPSGIAEFAFDVPENAQKIQLTAKCGDLSNSTTAKKFHSPSETYLQLSLVNKLPKAGDRVKIRLLSNVAFSSFSYMIMSRGRIVQARNVNRLRSKTRGIISFRARPWMAPTARVLVFFKRDNEIIPDGLTFNVMGAFRNKVSMEFDAAKVLPGDPVSLKLKAASNSLVATMVVDKSVILLKPGFDIEPQQVLDGLGKFDVGGNSFPTFIYRRRRKRLSIMPWPYPTYGGAEDAKAIFEEAGVLAMTDGLIYDYVEPIMYYPMMMMAMSDMAMPLPVMAFSGLMEVERVRTRFIETWLWNLVKIGKSGETTIPMVAPDTMTTWVGTAFAVNKRYGFGITESPTEITVLKPFYVNVVLPYSVIRGEQLALQANVFNYMDTAQQVVVELSSSDDFECLDVDAEGAVQAVECSFQTVVVEPGSAASVFFPIIPRELGKIDITVSARSSEASDSLMKALLVEPEGFEEEYNQAVIIDLSPDAPINPEETLSVGYPTNLVPGSQRVLVKVLGDFLSNTLNSMSKLLKMSYGCGEQNMINFAPTVFVANYLERIGQLTAERRAEALNMISSGYQRQMNYMRVDGSFSAFGDRDSSGSTWLTLFVWKSFTQAKKFTTIDETRLQSTLAFIVRQQNDDGSFNEPGRVIHRDMQGGSSEGIAMAAYALAALIENNDGSLDATISKTQVYVEQRIFATTDPYTVTICAYALELAKSLLIDRVRDLVNSIATSENGQMYWKATVPAEEPGYRWQPPMKRAMAINVEATAYGLLACAEEGDVGRCLTILPWLVNQQNSNGGFVSTQDTVVAVHALSSFANAIYSENITMSITVASGGQQEKFDVDESSRFVEQSAVLRAEPGDVTVSGTGVGRAVVQLSVRFNIYEDILEPAFNSSVDVVEQSMTEFTIQVCTSYLLEGKSGMALIEIQFPTGFSVGAESESFFRIVAKRVENEERKIIMYFDEIGGDELCFPVSATRTGMAAKLQPVNVIVSDYYEPDQRVVTAYLPSILADSDVCDVCKDNCQMCQKRKRK